MTTPDDLSVLGDKHFADAISKLEELLTQSGRAFLIGAGCSKCADLPLMAELTDKTLSSDLLNATTKNILTALKNLFDGAAIANIEDYLSELIDLLAIVERRELRGATKNQIDLEGTVYSAQQLRDAAEQIKRGIAEVINCKVSIDTHQRFIKAVHHTRRPGKSSSDQTVDYLVLNYDTLIEDALALARLPFADGIEGGATGWWSPSTFDRNDLAARVFKLHGSIDWCEFSNDPLPRRVGNSLQITSANDRQILIWPASTKYRETQLDPYAQLAGRARRALPPRRGSQCVLVMCGYSFGDAHINHEIDQALRESCGDLTIVAFTSDNEPSGLLQAWNSDSSVKDQVLIFANRGFFHGDQAHLATVDLPWWKFENITRLLGGER
jgi:hypothetical protein